MHSRRRERLRKLRRWRRRFDWGRRGKWLHRRRHKRFDWHRRRGRFHDRLHERLDGRRRDHRLHDGGRRRDAVMPRQYALEARKPGGPFFLGLHCVEHCTGFGRRRERVVRIALNRSQQPVAQFRFVRNHLARAARAKRGVDDVHELRGVLVVFQKPPEDQREGNRTDLQDVHAVIELGDSSRARQADAQALPVVLMRIPELLERRTEHVVGDDDASARVDDDAFRAERAVREIAVVRVEALHRRQDLTRDAQSRADLERDAAFGDAREQLREPYAVDGVRHDRERAGLEAFDATQFWKRRMTEVDESVDGPRQSRFECRRVRELCRYAQQLGLVPGRIDHPTPLTEGVTKHDIR